MNHFVRLTQSSTRRCNKVSSDPDFTLVELFIVCTNTPLIAGALSPGMISIFGLENYVGRVEALVELESSIPDSRVNRPR